MIDEPEIVINGHRLTIAQSMTVRVALGSFTSSLIENGLGEDKVGKAICEGYLEASGQVTKIMVTRGGK